MSSQDTLLATLFIGSLLAIFWGWYGQWGRRKKTDKQEDQTVAVKEAGIVGNLIDAQESAQDTAAFRQLQDRLALQLLRLTPADAAQLTRKQKFALRRQLQFSVDTAWPVYRDVPYVMALLKGISMFDDAETLQIVTQLAERSSQPQIRQAASECQAVLMQRVASRAQHRKLVRSSVNPTQSSDALLRPQSRSGQEEAIQLVRPSDDQ